MLVAEGGRG